MAVPTCIGIKNKHMYIPVNVKCERERGGVGEKTEVHTQTHQFSILFLLEGGRTVCRFASSGSTTIRRDRREK